MESLKTIMLIEDDDDLRNYLGEALSNEGYAVLKASNGHIALEMLINGKKPDLLIIDSWMTAMDSNTFIQILSANNRLADIPVIVTSSDQDVSKINGANTVVRKPFILDLFLEVIKESCK